MSRSDQPDPSGILVIDKPPGLTSHDVVARVRRMVGMKRVGHGGTLDPFATGVLPVAVGRATRILQFVQSSSKGYLANAVLGVETDSGDVEGTIVSRSTSNAAPPIEVIRDCLRHFTGTLEQVPPVLSAIKLDGQPLHRRVRSGEKVEASPRTITIYDIEVVSYEPPNLCIAVACASGAYVRALVRDIGRALGTHAYCHALRRTNAGPFCLGGSWTLSDLRDVDLRSEWPRFALGMDSGVTHLPAILIAESEMDRWYHGRSLTIPYSGRSDGANLVRIYDAEGRFAGIGQHETTGSVSPRFVLPREPRSE